MRVRVAGPGYPIWVAGPGYPIWVAGPGYPIWVAGPGAAAGAIAALIPWADH